MNTVVRGNPQNRFLNLNIHDTEHKRQSLVILLVIDGARDVRDFIHVSNIGLGKLYQTTLCF